MLMHQIQRNAALILFVIVIAMFATGERDGHAQTVTMYNFKTYYYQPGQTNTPETLWSVSKGYCWLTGLTMGFSDSSDWIHVDQDSSGNWQIEGVNGDGSGSAYAYAACAAWPEGYTKALGGWTTSTPQSIDLGKTNHCFCSIAGLKWNGYTGQTPEFRIDGYPSSGSAELDESMTNDDADGVHSGAANCLCPASTPTYVSGGNWTDFSTTGGTDLTSTTSSICGFVDGRVTSSGSQAINWGLEPAGDGFDWSLYNYNTSTTQIFADCVPYPLIYQTACGGDAYDSLPGPDWPSDDGLFSSPSSVSSVANAINMSLVSFPEPEAMYQQCRSNNGTFTETLTGFAASSSHTIRLHFAENYLSDASEPGARKFNVDINGTRMLTNFDVWNTAFQAQGSPGGGTGKFFAVEKDFTGQTADASGNYTITFSQGTANNPMISGIEIQ
jgi:hypothetical protein